MAAGRRLQVAWLDIEVASRCHMYGTSRRDAVRRELNHVEVRQDERVRQAERIRPGEGQPRVARGIDHVGVRNLLHCHRLAQAEDAVGIRERDVLDVGYRIVGLLFAAGPPDLEGGHARRRHMQRHGVFRRHAVRNANDRRVEVLVWRDQRHRSRTCEDQAGVDVHGAVRCGGRQDDRRPGGGRELGRPAVRHALADGNGLPVANGHILVRERRQCKQTNCKERGRLTHTASIPTYLLSHLFSPFI